MIDFSARTKGRNVKLMVTCICDAFFDDVARATVEVLEHAGCSVSFPEGQTCCGQPAFNAGDWASSRKVVRHTVKVFEGSQPIVVPSGSCAAMGFHGAPLAFESEPDLKEIEQVANRTWELCDFLVNACGIDQWPGKVERKIAFHRSCHSRGTPSGPAALKLLESIEGLEVVPFGEAEQCCGFGGVFSVAFPNVSKRMGELKIANVLAEKPDDLVSADMGCLLHLRGIMEKERTVIPTRHVAQVLAEALSNR